MSIKNENENAFLLKNPKFINSLRLIDIPSDQDFKSSLEIKNSVKNSDFNLRFDKKTKNIFKQDNKGKLKKKKADIIDSDQDQYSIFKKKTKSKLIVNTQDDLNNIGAGSIKSNKQKKKEKLKQKLNVNVDIHDDNKSVIIDRPLTIEELSIKLQIPPAEIITGLFLQGISVTVNQVVDISTAIQVAQKYNFTVVNQKHQLEVSQLDKLQEVDSSIGINRAPIITILGHVDHGKTSLLDAIRNTNFVSNEIGGITQSVSAYEVNYSCDSLNKKLIFIDTPGHEAFSSMRLRCTQMTDIVILIVAADDGLKPQTIEAIDYIISKKLPYIVAINKIDKMDINLSKVREQLANYNILSTDWGGDIEFVEISALKKINIDALLTSIFNLAESINLKTDPKQLAQGIILEAYLDKTKGTVVNTIILNGTLKVGEIIVSDNSYGRVKKIVNNLGHELLIAEPSSILQVLGFYSVPQPGKYFHVVQSEKEAKKLITQSSLSNITENTKNLLNSHLQLYNYNNKVNIKNLNLIIKADTQGTIDAVINSFIQIPQSKIKLNILTSSLGVVSSTDLDLAFNTEALIIAFNINITTNILNAAEKLNVHLCKFVLIYDLIDYVKNYMLDLIDPEYDKLLIGQAKVQTTFFINKGTVAGCIVKSGKLKKNALINVYREDKLIYEGVINSLKRMKDDVNEVVIGNECGIMCTDYNLWQPQDLIEVYELYEKPKVL
uniref:translation initiation factor 2 n=1 Tax=Gracilaria flabelliformis subsp. simplex TaxID=1638138 RepID=UPI001D126F73|nr:translation initiation factor 2 [Gracilaria flabelliformis subsp. simplex]UAD86009.1 translation initiation factor 2 [Gracilaria flabelliformis subsp. simplex]